MLKAWLETSGDDFDLLETYGVIEVNMFIGSHLIWKPSVFKHLLGLQMVFDSSTQMVLIIVVWVQPPYAA